MVQWLARLTSDLEVGGSSLVSAVAMFSQARNFTPRCLSLPGCINKWVPEIIMLG